MLQCPSRKSVCIGLTIFFIGGIGFAALDSAMTYTSRMEFCVSCHSMKTNYAEYKKTLHYKNASGVRASCADCHVPDAFFPKVHSKLFALRDVVYEWIGTIDSEEKFEAKRWQMASRVWARMRANDSRECRSCHEYRFMEFDQQGERAGKKHSRTDMRGKTCIDCHSGLVHEEPLEPAGLVQKIQPQRPQSQPDTTG
jgi:cytochrome c-type protein NapC